jgi:hypothetical protein
MVTSAREQGNSFFEKHGNRKVILPFAQFRLKQLTIKFYQYFQEHSMKHLFYLIVAMLFVAAPLIAQTEETAAKAKAPSGDIQVLDAKVGTEIQDKEITGEGSSFTVGAKVWFWLKVKGAANESLTITWKCGDFSKESKLAIGGSPYRTWTAKNVAKAGDWTVTVSDASGNALKELKFTVK